MDASSATFAPLSYLSRMWRLRYFLLSLVGMDLRNRYKRSVLGVGWSLIRPMAMTAVCCLVFCPLFNQPVRTFAPFFLSGFTVWGLIMESVNGGCLCFITSAAYIRQQPVPLALFPLRVVLGGGIHAGLAFLMVIALVTITTGLPSPLMLPPLLLSLVLLLVFCWSFALILGLIHTHFPDTQHLVEILFQILFYLTPIIYLPDMVRGRGAFGRFVDYNPLTYLMEAIRLPILQNQVPSATTYAIFASFVGFVFLLALWLRHKLEKNLVFWL
ncbi:MAG: ABC transporter permease [Gemmataceae bacterium]